MRNMYAVKCLYKWDIYDSGDALLNETTYNWEERIILIRHLVLKMQIAKVKSMLKNMNKNILTLTISL